MTSFSSDFILPSNNQFRSDLIIDICPVSMSKGWRSNLDCGNWSQRWISVGRLDGWHQSSFPSFELQRTRCQLRRQGLQRQRNDHSLRYYISTNAYEYINEIHCQATAFSYLVRPSQWSTQSKEQANVLTCISLWSHLLLYGYILSFRSPQFWINYC